jgi:hypothetical protein
MAAGRQAPDLAQWRSSPADSDAWRAFSSASFAVPATCIFGNEESLVMKLDEAAVPRIADALASIPSRPSDDPR